MGIRKSKSTGSFVIVGNNPALVSELSKSFVAANVEHVSSEAEALADYCIFIHNPSAPHNSGQLNDLLRFLDSSKNQHSKYVLIFQHSNLVQESTINPYLQVITELTQKRSIDFRILHVYDLISTTDNVLSPLDKIIRASYQDRQIHITSSGNLKLFPLSYSDFYSGLSRALYTQNTSSQIYYMGGTQITDIDFAITLKNICKNFDVDLEIIQDQSETGAVFDIERHIDTTSSLLNWLPQTDIEVYIGNILSLIVQNSDLDLVTNHKKSPKQESLNKKIVIAKPRYPIDGLVRTISYINFVKLTLYFALISVLLFILVFSAFLGPLFLSTRHTDKSYKLLRSGNIDQAVSELKRSNSYLHISRTSFSYISPTISFFSPLDLQTIDSLLLLITHTNASLERLTNIYTLGRSYVQDSLSSNQTDTATISSSIASELEAFRTELNQLSLLKDSVNAKRIFYLFTIPLPDKYNTDNLSLLKAQVSSAISLVRIIPALFPDNETRRYLFIVQDNNQYHPTGGSIASYVLLTFQGNRLLDSKIESALTIGKNIDGQVVSPPQIMSITGEAALSFSDSNYSPNFPESASQIAWQFGKYTGTVPDGIIAINLNFYQNLLKYTGGIDIPNYPPINSDNFRLILSNTTPEISAELLTLITTKVFSDIKSHNYSFAAVFRSIFETISNSDINLWHNNLGTQDLIASTILSGVLKSASCPPKFLNVFCFSETFSINEASYSLEKSNYFHKRNIDHTINIASSGSVTHEVLVNYSYPALPSNLANTNYKAIVRLIIPPGTRVDSISMDKQDIPTEQIAVRQVNDLIEVSFPIDIILNRNHQLQANFTSAKVYDFKNSLSSYALTTIKQSGISNTDQIVKITYPNHIKPQTLSLPASVGNQMLLFQESPLSTSTYAVTFGSTGAQ